MPQTVPSTRGQPCEYGDLFDLSLLPACGPNAPWPASSSADCEVPYSPTSVHQLMSLFCDATPSPPPMFPSEPVPLGDPLGDPLYKPGKEPLQEHGLQGGLQGRQQVKSEPQSTYLGSCSSWETQTALFAPYIKQEQQDASVPQLQDFQDLQDDQRSTGDHQLLREVLKDTSFQRKFNLKPFDLGGLNGLAQQLSGPQWAPLRRTLSGGSGSGASGQLGGLIKMEECDDHLPQLDQDAIEPMISLAIQQMRNEIGNTCSMLGIAPGQSSAMSNIWAESKMAGDEGSIILAIIVLNGLKQAEPGCQTHV